MVIRSGVPLAIAVSLWSRDQHLSAWQHTYNLSGYFNSLPSYLPLHLCLFGCSTLLHMLSTVTASCLSFAIFLLLQLAVIQVGVIASSFSSHSHIIQGVPQGKNQLCTQSSWRCSVGLSASSRAFSLLVFALHAVQTSPAVTGFLLPPLGWGEVMKGQWRKVWALQLNLGFLNPNSSP